MSDPEFDELTLHAAADGELDAMGMLTFERARAADPALAKRYEQLLALRGALRGHSSSQRSPDALRDRIAAMAMMQGADDTRVTKRMNFGARPRMALAASVIGAFMLGALAANMFARQAGQPQSPRVAMLLVDDHRRSLLAREPIDVESSDRHTVKPWFDQRLALSPGVVDLSAAGITLVGGRAEVVDGAPAPTIVYRLREHLISVTALPAARFSPAPANAVNGYQTIAWADAAFAYWAVSDLPRADLEAFVSAFKAGEAAGEASR